MNINIKDRVVLAKKSKSNMLGTIVKLYKGKSNSIRTCGVLWDNDWPKDYGHSKYYPGKVFYYKPEDLKIAGTWRI